MASSTKRMLDASAIAPLIHAIDDLRRELKAQGKAFHGSVAFVVDEKLPVRREMLEDRPHVVVPVVAVVEGVHSGSAGAWFYPADEIEASTEYWNGVPLPVFHPMKDGQPLSANSPELISKQSVGRLFSARFDPNYTKGPAVRGELWIDEARCQKISPDVLALVRSGGQLEVSTGLFSSDDTTPGTWNGEDYLGTIKGIIPDHLALLPGGEGACNWDDGCGVRANRGGKNMSKILTQFKALAVKLGITVQEESVNDLQRAVSDAVRALNKDDWDHWVEELFDDSVVYTAVWDGDGTPPADVRKLYRRNYQIDDEMQVTLGDDVQEVRERREYVPVTANQAAQCGHEEDHTMANKEKVDALVACDQTRFTEDNREWLMTLSEEQLESVQAPEPPEEDKDGAPKPPDAPKDPPADDSVPKDPPDPPPVDTKQAASPLKFDDWMATAPPEYRGFVNDAVEERKARKAVLVKALVGNERCRFTAKDLQAMDVKALEHLTELARIEVDHSLQAGVTASATDSPPAPPTLKDHYSKK